MHLVRGIRRLGKLLICGVMSGVVFALGNAPPRPLPELAGVAARREHIAEDPQMQWIEETIATARGSELIRFPNFSVEMETGTGKTYVYLRTALELHRRYGMRKFIIVVPSVAVREGVLKTRSEPNVRWIAAWLLDPRLHRPDRSEPALPLVAEVLL